MKNEPVHAWQPLTFGGVARYAHDGIGRLFITGIIVSVVCVAAVLVTVRNAWQPVITDAISNLPTGGEIRAAKLSAPQPATLAANKFLSLALDPTGESNPSSGADIHVTFSRDELRIRSLFGTAPISYQPNWRIPLTRAETEPWWGAWRPAVYAYVAAGTALFLFTSWIALAIPYAILPISFGVNRQVSVIGSWKLSVAALMPGALFFAFAILLYGLGQLRVEGLLVAWALHFAIGWAFLVGAIFWLPRKNENPFKKKSRRNPFGDDEADEAEEPAPRRTRGDDNGHSNSNESGGDSDSD